MFLYLKLSSCCEELLAWHIGLCYTLIVIRLYLSSTKQANSRANLGAIKTVKIRTLILVLRDVDRELSTLIILLMDLCTLDD